MLFGTVTPVTLQERLAQAEQEREQVVQIQRRAIAAANEAGAALFRLEGKLQLLRDLIAEGAA